MSSDWTCSTKADTTGIKLHPLDPSCHRITLRSQRENTYGAQGRSEECHSIPAPAWRFFEHNTMDAVCSEDSWRETIWHPSNCTSFQHTGSQHEHVRINLNECGSLSSLDDWTGAANQHDQRVPMKEKCFEAFIDETSLFIVSVCSFLELLC